MKHPIYLSLIICLFSCNSNNSGNNAEKTSEHLISKEAELSVQIFTEFFEVIPSIPPPLNFHCGLPDGPGSNHIWVSDYNKYRSFIPNGFDKIFASLGSYGKFKAIIFGQSGDSIYPTLFTYDNQGKIIDSLFLILNPCGKADAEQIPNSYVTIDNDLIITMVDTTKYIHYPDNNGNYIIDSLRISKEIHWINNDGEILKK